MAASGSTLAFGCFPYLVPLFLGRLLLTSLVLLQLAVASTVICMSEPTIEVPVSDLQALIDSSNQLLAAVRRVQQSVASPISHPHWEVVAQPFVPCGFPDFPSVAQVTILCGAETGPPELPQACLDFALPKLSPLFSPLPEVRVLWAFRRGFWDKISVDCHIEQLTSSHGEPVVDLPVCHCVVLRTVGFSHPVRFTSLSDFERSLCTGECGPVWRGFSSIEEVEAYCVGAAVRVPVLLKWKNLH